MSFILDALKKSETERQQQAGAEFASVPASAPTPRRGFWVWVVALLLAVNLAVLLGILLRPDPGPPVSEPGEPVAASRTAVPPRSDSSFAEQVESARRSLPEAPAASAPDPEIVTEAPVPQPAAGEAATVSRQPADRIPTIDELRLDGLIDLPELRIDIHVYSDDPAERFVFINMNKQREGTVLPSGPSVREIKADGVVLEHRGRTFLLPRE